MIPLDHRITGTGSESSEAKVREAKRGRWADPHPVPPWEWRKAGVSAQRPRQDL